MNIYRQHSGAYDLDFIARLQGEINSLHKQLLDMRLELAAQRGT